MKKYIFKIAIVVSALLLVVFVFFHIGNVLGKADRIGERHIENLFENEQYKIYKKRWGLTGDHSEIILEEKSTNNKMKFDRPIFVEVLQDKVLLYIREDIEKYGDEWENSNLSLVTITKDQFLKLNEKEHSRTFFMVMK